MPGPTRAIVVLGVAAAGIFAAPQPTGAQEEEAPVVLEELVVRAPRTVVYETADVAASGMKTERVELRRRASYADLDLSRQADVAALEGRIEAVAREACEALGELYPLDNDPRETERCVRRAIADAQEQLEEVVATAN